MPPAVSIIANPTAGYRQPPWRAPVERILSALGRVEFITPDSAEATSVAARECEARGASLIVAAGGDGTVHRVVNGLQSAGTRVGILPVGSANDLAGYLGVPASPLDAARTLLGCADRDIDVIRINGRRVLTVGVFCAVAEAVRLADRMRRGAPWLGALAYRAAAAQMIVTRGRDPLAGVFLANVARLGGNLHLPSGSVPDDGVCEMATLRGGSRVALARTLFALSLGRALPPGTLTWAPVRETSLEFGSPVPASGDGEYLGCECVFQVRVEPGAMRIAVGPTGS